ncbi:hypothetical protein GCM10028819_50290 [Spirosoma humi]
MKIKRLVIENFKSIERIELIEPNPFTVFVGPNGSGKSNIFEALEFWNLYNKIGGLSESLFGGKSAFLNRNNRADEVFFFADLGGVTVSLEHNQEEREVNIVAKTKKPDYKYGDFQFVDQFYESFSRIFLRKVEIEKLHLTDDKRLSLSAKNLEKVLKRILLDTTLKSEIFEWLELFIPRFKAVEIDDRDELHWFEEFSPEYFTKDLISDGTYNILALLTAIYQSEEPQFLCIEEPENGLHPDVIKELVNLCRYACEQQGHFIWLNTHSQTLASQLTADEIIVVDKVKGATQTKQFKGHDFHGLRMDEVWLMNALGGGLPW